MPRTGARRSSLEALSRGRWASRAPFGGWGRCGRLFSAPPMCQAGWSRGSCGCGRGRLLSGGRFKSPRPFRAAPRKRGACAAAGTAAHFREVGDFFAFSAQNACILHVFHEKSPYPPALSHSGKGARGHGIRAAGNRLRAGSAAAQVTACGPGNAPNRPAVPFAAVHDTHGLSLRQGPQKNPDGIFLLLPLDPSTSRGCADHAKRQNKHRKEMTPQ